MADEIPNTMVINMFTVVANKSITTYCNCSSEAIVSFYLCSTCQIKFTSWIDISKHVSEAALNRIVPKMASFSKVCGGANLKQTVEIILGAICWWHHVQDIHHIQLCSDINVETSTRAYHHNVLRFLKQEMPHYITPILWPTNTPDRLQCTGTSVYTECTSAAPLTHAIVVFDPKVDISQNIKWRDLLLLPSKKGAILPTLPALPCETSICNFVGVKGPPIILYATDTR